MHVANCSFGFVKGSARPICIRPTGVFRYYDPETATYIQRDPLGYADGMNVYMSVHGNPISGA